MGIATQAIVHGTDGGWAVLYGPTPLSPTSMQLAIDEDQIKDSERRHTDERVAVLVFEEAVSLELSAP